MLKSAGRRFLIVGVLTLLMFIPLTFAADVVEERAAYSESTIESVGDEWGGAQLLSGPQLVIPVERSVTRLAQRPRLDPDTGIVMTDPETGRELIERFEQVVQERVASVYLYPERFDARIETATEERRRGLFRVPVFVASVEARFGFDTDLVQTALNSDERSIWEEAELRVGVSRNRALRGVARLTTGESRLPLEPLAQRAGIVAPIGDPRDRDGYLLQLGMNGAQRLYIAPVGRESQVEMVSDWPHPSFAGAFLPDGSEVSDQGFRAVWTIPHLARSLPQVSRDDPEDTARRETGFGVRYLTPNDFYQKAYRAARYGILFIALTFLTVLLIERGAQRPAHPVQYILAGLAQTVFVLLMVSYAEHIGFGAAYLLSSGAVIGLLTLFGAVALKLGRRALVLGAVLTVVYAVLYLILQSADYALLAGSTLAFLALALTMIMTRNEEWYGPDAGKPRGPGPLRRMFGGGEPSAARPAPPEAG